MFLNKMIVNKDLIHKIKDYFDLNIYETKVWLALLGKGVASAGEIAEISRVPRSRTYDVLETLEKKGFAIVKLGKPVKYIGVKPKIVLEKLKNNIKHDAEERVVTLANINDTEEFSTLESIYLNGMSPIKREELSLSLKGKSNITNYLRDILQNASKEVIMCTNAEEVKSKLRLFEQTFGLLSKAGIKIRVALSGDVATIKELSAKLNLKIKQIDIDSKFFVVDRKEILFYLSKKGDDEDIAIWLNSEFFISAFVALFEKAMGGEK
jgi:HTH-type transcriptional regulator, sugar sensing transcriptional regulator